MQPVEQHGGCFVLGCVTAGGCSFVHILHRDVHAALCGQSFCIFAVFLGGTFVDSILPCRLLEYAHLLDECLQRFSGTSVLLTCPCADRFLNVASAHKARVCPAHITSVKQIPLDGFEGCLQRNPNTGHWRICYNPDQESQGRVRFTLAHELGHFVLHRMKGEEGESEEPRTEFLCSEVDMNDWDSPLRKMEAEADTFASCLLMPLDDFRKQVAGHQSMSRELLDHCCHRYGVSRMAAALKWIEIAPRRTVVVAVRDGHVLWARSNQRAYKSGCYLPARQRTIAVPGQSLLAEAEQTGGTQQGAA